MGGFFTVKPVKLADGTIINYKEGAFSHDETKPTGADIANGSIIIEPDTGKVFFYNRASDTWVEQFSFQG